MSKTCVKCQKQFPIWMYVDGKDRNLSSRKYCLECSPWNMHNVRTLEKPPIKIPEYKQCVKCKVTKSISEFYSRNDGKYKVFNWCKECASRIGKGRTRKKKTEMLELSGGKCTKCGYNKCYGALEFHHTNPKEKEIITSLIRLPMHQLKQELKKCVLLCANCHREEHHGSNSFLPESSNIRYNRTSLEK